MPKNTGFTAMADDSIEDNIKPSRLKKSERFDRSAHARNQRATLRVVREGREKQVKCLLARADANSAHHGRKIVQQAKKIADQSGLRITLKLVDDHFERQVERPGSARRAARANNLAAKQKMAELVTLLAQANDNPGNCRHLLAQVDQLVVDSDYEIILVEVPGKIGFQRELKRRSANQPTYALAA